MTVRILVGDWHGLYKEGWQGEIVPEAFSHPAKFARGLIRRIYQHMVEEGWLAEGDVVVDPFAGVALGGLDAMFYGLRWVGVELEEKFVDLGGQNVTLWNVRYGNGMLPRWGTAVLLQGDSRHLCEILEGARAEGLVSSPPWYTPQTHERGHIMDEGTPAMKRCKSSHAPAGYVPPKTEGQLGNMREGDVDAVIGSPPHSPQGLGHDAGHPRLDSIEDARRASEGCARRPAYGHSDGQLAAMPEGDVDAVIGSPPFAKDAEPHGDLRPDDGRKILHKPERGYGDAEGQLAAMPEGEPLTDYTYTPGSLTPTQFDARAVTESITFAAGPKQQKTIECECNPMSEGDFEAQAVISSPPWMQTNNQFPSNTGVRQAIGDWADKRVQYAESRVDLYNELPYMSPEWLERRKESAHQQNLSRLPAESKDPEYPTFWSAARQVVEQCYQLLAPGGHAVWVVKDFVRDKKRVLFCDQWRQMCEAVGFVTLHEHRCWLVEERGAQYRLDGDLEKRTIERKSFFRRLAEKKGSPRIDHETVWCMVKG